MHANATALPFADGHFDKIACLGMLGYLSRPDLRDVLAQCARVLKAQGTLLICTGDTP